jgi:hypothetical protein
VRFALAAGWNGCWWDWVFMVLPLGQVGRGVARMTTTVGPHSEADVRAELGES